MKISIQLTIIVFCLMTFVQQSVAQETEEARITSIKKGQVAPFDGVLLNPSATAKLISEKEYSEKECGIKIDYELAKQKAKYDLEIGNLKIDLDLANKKYDVVVKLKDDEIKRLTEFAIKAENKSNNYVWWATGGVAAGIILSIGTFVAVSNLSK